MEFKIRLATEADTAAITELIRASVLELQPQYTATQQIAALQTVFTLDSRLLLDRTYFVAESTGTPAGCGGWSFRGTLYGGDHHLERGDVKLLDPVHDAAKIRAIFVHPRFARMGLGSLLLAAAENAAKAAGFRRFEMGSTLAGIALYARKGYLQESRIEVPIGAGETITVIRMTKAANMSNEISSNVIA